MHETAIIAETCSRGETDLQYKLIIRHVDRDETVEQFDFLDEVLDYLRTHLGHVFGRKDVLGIMILKED